jgi:hypothetical protein
MLNWYFHNSSSIISVHHHPRHFQIDYAFDSLPLHIDLAISYHYFQIRYYKWYTYTCINFVSRYIALGTRYYYDINSL